jgi:hypothetical protein
MAAAPIKPGQSKRTSSRFPLFCGANRANEIIRSKSNRFKAKSWSRSVEKARQFFRGPAPSAPGRHTQYAKQSAAPTPPRSSRRQTVARYKPRRCV